MANLTISNETLQVGIGPLEAIQALQGSFSIPLSKVRGATPDQNYITAGLGLRSPGTGLPGRIARGTFRKIGEKTLALWGRSQEIVVIELENSKWNRLIIGCEDAKLLSNQINSALAR